MKSIDWGRLAARLLAVLFVVWAVTNLAYFIPMSFQLSDVLMGLVVAALAPILQIAIGVAVWVNADRFVPTPTSDETPSPIAFGSLLVAGVMTFVFFQFGRALLEHILEIAAKDELRRVTPVWAPVAEGIVCLLCVVAIVNAREVCRWLAR